MNTTPYVTAKDMTVSYETGNHLDGVILRVGWYSKQANDSVKLTFPTEAEARAYAIERGYLVPYVRRTLDEIMTEMGLA